MLDAYAAGMVDADGSIIIGKINWRMNDTNHRTPDYKVSVQVTNVYRPMLDVLAATYGGTVQRKPLSTGSFFSRREHFNWSVTGQKAVEMLVRLHPYLLVKKDQSWLAQEFWAQRTRGYGKPTSPEECALREGFYLAMKQLKGTN